MSAELLGIESIIRSCLGVDSEAELRRMMLKTDSFLHFTEGGGKQMNRGRAEHLE